MTEKSDKQVAMSGQLLSMQSLTSEQPAAAPSHQTSSEPLEAAASARSDAHIGRSLAQISIVLVVLLVLVNIPISFHGAGLAQTIPKATAIVIYDGMVLKGSGPELYVLEDHVLRRIGSPEALDHFLRQNTVQVVEDNVLESFGKGRSIYRLVTCPNSPHVYVLEQGHKRWVKDPPTGNKAKPWDEVHLVSCDYLRQLPEGPPILENARALP